MKRIIPVAISFLTLSCTSCLANQPFMRKTMLLFPSHVTAFPQNGRPASFEQQLECWRLMKQHQLMRQPVLIHYAINPHTKIERVSARWDSSAPITLNAEGLSNEYAFLSDQHIDATSLPIQSVFSSIQYEQNRIGQIPDWSTGLVKIMLTDPNQSSIRCQLSLSRENR